MRLQVKNITSFKMFECVWFALSKFLRLNYDVLKFDLNIKPYVFLCVIKKYITEEMNTVRVQ